MGFKTYRKSAELTDLKERRARVQRRASRAKDLNQQTLALMDENQELSSRTFELQAVSGTGEQLARALAALDRHLPAEFWVEKIESHVGNDTSLGIESKSERPILRLEGRSRDSAASPTALFQGLLTDLEEDLGESVVLNPTFDGKRFTIDLTLFSPLREESPELEQDGA